MSYVFDTGIFSQLFRNYYPTVFPSLWEKFDMLTMLGDISSVREVLREINDGPLQNMKDWAAENAAVFSPPTPEEGAFISQIYGIKHFQQNIQQQALLKGGQIADPFVIAKAAVAGDTVVTTELFKPNAVKIPNICDHFNVPCMTLQDFMKAEGWTF